MKGSRNTSRQREVVMSDKPRERSTEERILKLEIQVEMLQRQIDEIYSVILGKEGGSDE